MNEAYPRFGDFLNATGRPMLYSCSWPDYLNDHVNFRCVRVRLESSGHEEHNFHRSSYEEKANGIGQNG